MAVLFIVTILWNIWATLCLGFDETSVKKEYDYIIIGGGTAGCVVAGRLSEDRDKSVLVLEAGPDDKSNLLIPVPFAQFTAMSVLDWGYMSEPLKYGGQEHIGKRAPLASGKVLGGSGSINSMVVSRGSRHDFNLWQDLGNKGWSYNHVLKYFKKSENMLDPELAANSFHGVRGPWAITKLPNTNLSDIFIQAGRELGYDEVDYNGQNQIGFSTLQQNIKQGRRDSTVDAFIRPVMGRRNLDVKTGAFVTKIEFDRTKTAIGVHYDSKGKTSFVKVAKEVIVSAGALNSPKILMLSGIGPKQHLNSFGIPVIADLPVGKNLEDHVYTYLSYFINESLSLTDDKLNTFEALAAYVFEGTGTWASNGGQGVSFIRTKTQSRKDKFPHLEFFKLPFLFGSSDDNTSELTERGNIDPELFNAVHDAEKGQQGVTFGVLLLHPRTKGSVQLMGRDPFSQPKIKLSYLKSPRDVKEMIEGIRFIQKLTKTKPYRALNATLTFPPHPTCNQIEFDSDEYWRCHLLQKSYPFQYYASTCRMAPGTRGVVNNRLRVKKIKNVRVVDASVMPHITSGNTMATVVMIAEKAADMIKQDA